MPRPNWFFAFPVPGDFVRALPKPPGAFRLFHPDDVHLTLAFLGACDEPAVARALAILDERRADALSPVTISLGAVVPMGGARAYTALSAEVVAGGEELSRTLADLGNQLVESATGRVPRREPKPHVTIARPKFRATDADRQAGLDWAAALDLGAQVATLDRVALYTWDETRRERLFHIVTERPLM